MKNFITRSVPFVMAFLFFQNCSVGWIKHDVSGTVRFKNNGNAVAGAQVWVIETNNGGRGRSLGSTSTDNAGFFMIQYTYSGGDAWQINVRKDNAEAFKDLGKKQKKIDIEI